MDEKEVKRTTNISHIKDLKPDPNNPRRHNPRNIGMIVSSLQEVGPARSIVIDENGVILAGNGTIEAAAQAGIENIMVVEAPDDTIIAHLVRNKTSLQKRRISLYDNRSAELADWEPEEIKELDNKGNGVLDGLFYREEIEDILKELVDNPADTPDDGGGGDDFEDEPDEGQTRVKVGDIWQAGRHKIICADARDPRTYDDLLDGIWCNGIFTSPPYAEQRSAYYEGIRMDEYQSWWAPIQASLLRVLKEDGSFFLNLKAHTEQGERVLYVMELVLAMKKRWGWRYVDELCWTRITAPGAWPDRFKNGWEPVYQFAHDTGGAGNIKFRPHNVQYEGLVPDSSTPYQRNAGTGIYYHVRQKNVMGTAYPDNVINTGPSDKGVSHPAIFPIALPTFFMKAYSDAKDVWLDPFLGSGTTIVAAERTARTCHGIDNSPAYCDLALRRAEAEGISPIVRVARLADGE